MDAWTAIMVLGIVLIATIGKVMSRRTKVLGATNGQEASALREDVRALRERVQVLERALTEPSNRLAREIEDLRD